MFDRSIEHFKKRDRVRVKSAGRFTGEVGTVIILSDWVFSSTPEIGYIVDLDSGATITCDPEDLELAEEET